jgi:hypothetical protein
VRSLDVSPVTGVDAFREKSLVCHRDERDTNQEMAAVLSESDFEDGVMETYADFGSMTITTP